MNVNQPTSIHSQNDWLVMVCVLVAVGVASWCGVSLAYDGSCYLFETLEWQEAVTPHHRLINLALLEPVVWLSRHGWTPVALARWHTLLCFVPLMVSAAMVLVLLRGPLAALRWWAVAGVLILPLPGMMCPISEVVPALELVWPLLAAVWAGARPWQWLLVLPAGVALYHTHPAATLLFAVVGVAGLLTGVQAGGAARWWRIAFGAAAVLAAVSRLAFTWDNLNDYERGQFSILQALAELRHALLCSPWLAVLGVFLIAFTSFKPEGDGRVRRIARFLAGRGRWWLLGVAVMPMCHPVLWSGALNYRKLAVFTTLAFAVIASLAALRHLTGKGAAASAPRLHPGPAWLAMVFCASLCTGACSWQRLTSRFASDLERQPEKMVPGERFPGLRRTAADHWSATTLAFVLQGRSPQRAFLGPGVSQIQGGVQLYPGGFIRWDQAGWFQMEALR